MARKTVVITGGAGGIGKALAREYFLAGFNIVIGDLDAKAARETAEEIAATKITARQIAGIKAGRKLRQDPPRVLGLELDVTDLPSYKRFFAEAQKFAAQQKAAAQQKIAVPKTVTTAEKFTETQKQLGKISHLVLAAGVMWVGSFDDEPERALKMQLEVNLAGVIRGIKTGLPSLTEKGRIVVLASAASLLAPPGEATYAATKHGVLGYLKTVRAEMRTSRVRRYKKFRFITVMPGVVDTELAAGTASGAAKLLTPETVATRVVTESLKNRPRFELTIPGFIGPLNRFVSALPRPLRETLYRLMVPNQVKSTKFQARKNYETRFNRD